MINIPGELFLNRIANVDQLASDLHNKIAAALSNVKLNLDPSAVKTQMQAISKDISAANQSGFGGIIRSMNDMRKVGLEKSNVFSTMLSVLPAEAKKGEAAISALDRRLHQLFAAVTSGNKVRADAIGADLKKSFVGLGVSDPARQRVLEGLQQAAQLQIRLAKVVDSTNAMSAAKDRAAADEKINNAKRVSEAQAKAQNIGLRADARASVNEEIRALGQLEKSRRAAEQAGIGVGGSADAASTERLAARSRQRRLQLNPITTGAAQGQMFREVQASSDSSVQSINAEINAITSALTVKKQVAAETKLLNKSSRADAIDSINAEINALGKLEKSRLAAAKAGIQTRGSAEQAVNQSVSASDLKKQVSAQRITANPEQRKGFDTIQGASLASIAGINTEINAITSALEAQKQAETDFGQKVRENVKYRADASKQQRQIDTENDRGRKQRESDMTRFQARSAQEGRSIAKTEAHIVSLQEKARDILKSNTTLRNNLGRSDITSDVSTLQNFVAQDPAKIAASRHGTTPAIGLGFPDDATINKAMHSTREFNKELTSLASHRITLQSFGDAAALAFKRYGAFLIGSFGILKVISLFQQATTAAIDFEHSMTKIEQVLGVSSDKVHDISSAVREMSSITGTSANTIATGVLTFAQAGQKNIKDLAGTAKELAKVPLSATFSTIDATVEGLIAVQGQFNKKLSDTTEILDLVNQYSADFAVESADIFEGIKRGGAAFSIAGGSLEDFIGLFSILRESTRESAETLGTFFKTGLSQMLRPQSQKLLQQLGVTAQDTVGQLTQLAKILPTFGPKEQINIAIQLTGQRQFARLLSTLREVRDPTVQTRLQKASLLAPGSFDRSIAARMDDVGQSLARVTENFNNFILALSENQTLKTFVKDISELTVSLLNLGKIITPIIPLLATFGTMAVLPRVLGVLKTVGTRVGILSATGTTLGVKGLLGDAYLGAKSLFTPGITPSSRAIHGRALLKGGALLTAFSAGIALENTSLGQKKFSTNLNGSDIGGAATSGLLTGAVLGSIINPWLAAIAATVVALKSLDDAIEKNKEAHLQESLDKAQTPEDIVHAALYGAKPLANNEKGFNPFNFIKAEWINTVNLAKGATGNLTEDDLHRQQIANARAGSILEPDVDPLGKKGKGKITNRKDIDAIEISQRIRDKDISGTVFAGVVRNHMSKFQEELVARSRKTGEALTSGEGLNVSNKELTRYLHEILPALDNKGIAEVAMALRESGIKLAAAFDPKDFKNIMAESATKLRQALVEGSSSIIQIMKSLGKRSDLIGSIVTSGPNGLIGQRGASDNTALVRSGGFGQLADFEEQTRKMSDALTQLFAGNRADFEAFNEMRKHSEGELSPINSIEHFFQDLVHYNKDLDTSSPNIAAQLKGKADALTKTYGDLLSQLMVETDTSFEDLPTLIKNLTENSDAFETFVRTLRPGSKLIDQVADAIRKQIEVFNQEREALRTLVDGLRGLNDALYQTNNQISTLTNQMDTRNLLGSQFSNRVESGVSNQQQASLLLQQSRQTQFGMSVGQMVQETLTAANQRNTSAADAAALNRSGANPLDPANQQKFKDADAAQAKFLDQQQIVNQRLGEYDQRISAASSATDMLRQSFLELSGDIKSAGSAVSQFTVQDLAKSFHALKTFQQAGGFSDTNKGLASLDDKGFASLQQLLSSMGNLNLGNGISGNDLMGNINEQLGIGLAAATRSLVKGTSIGSETEAVKQELATRKKAAEEAGAEEKKLRTEQLELVKLQKELIEIEKQFFIGQQTVLGQAPQTTTADMFAELTKELTAFQKIVESGFKDLHIVLAPTTPATNHQSGFGDVHMAEREAREAARNSYPTNVPADWKPGDLEGYQGTPDPTNVPADWKSGDLEGYQGTPIPPQANPNTRMAPVPSAFVGPPYYQTFPSNERDATQPGFQYLDKNRPVGHATGGKVIGNGSGNVDTVPAMLAPGEYVINAAAAKKIGYNQLHQMNKSGKMQAFNLGGRVAIQRGLVDEINPLTERPYGKFEGGVKAVYNNSHEFRSWMHADDNKPFVSRSEDQQIDRKRKANQYLAMDARMKAEEGMIATTLVVRREEVDAIRKGIVAEKKLTDYQIDLTRKTMKRDFYRRQGASMLPTEIDDKKLIAAGEKYYTETLPAALAAQQKEAAEKIGSLPPTLKNTPYQPASAGYISHVTPGTPSNYPVPRPDINTNRWDHGPSDFSFNPIGVPNVPPRTPSNYPANRWDHRGAIPIAPFDQNGGKKFDPRNLPSDFPINPIDLNAPPDVRKPLYTPPHRTPLDIGPDDGMRVPKFDLNQGIGVIPNGHNDAELDAEFRKKFPAVFEPAKGPSIGKPTNLPMFGGDDTKSKLISNEVSTPTGPAKDITKTLDDIFSNDSVFKNLEFLKDISTNIAALNEATGTIRDLLQKLQEGDATKINFSVAPIQVNVALSVPDVIGLVGPEIQRRIMEEIGKKLAPIFKDDPEKSSAIADQLK